MKHYLDDFPCFLTVKMKQLEQVAFQKVNVL